MTTTDTQRLQKTLQAAKERGVLPVDATLPEDDRPSWIILGLSFVGAQLAVWPFLAFLAFTMHEILRKPSGSLVMSMAFLATGVFVLRGREKGLFFRLLAFNVLLAGVGLWCWTLWQFELDRWFLPVLAASLLGLAFLVRVHWVQSLLSIAFVFAFARIDWIGLFISDTYGYMDDGIGFLLNAYSLPLWLLSGVWWLWCAREQRWGDAAWVLKAHAFMEGMGVGLLLMVCVRLGTYAWLSKGSADAYEAGTAPLFHFDVWSAGSSLLVLASGLWLVWRWVYLPSQRRQAGGEKNALDKLPSPPKPTLPEYALWLVLYGAWAVLAFIVPSMGVLAVLFTVAWGTGRRRTLALALFVLLAQLSSFYYALQWPLVRKAGLLVAMGGILALAMAGLHQWGGRAAAMRSARLANEAGVRAGSRGVAVQRAGLAICLLLALVLTQWDVMKKERVLAQGQKIYMPLAPRDPRSIMQGDYMALNFDLPRKLVDGDEGDESAMDRPDQRGLNPLQGTALMVASLDAKNIATLQRRWRSNETLAPNEVLIPLKYMKGEWVVVTNAYFFPEGQGGVFRNARYGEFRLLGKGKVLLAGLADEKLQRIEPQPDRADEP